MSDALLLHIEKETLEVLSFRMIDVYRVIAWLVETVEDAYAAATLGGCRENCESEGLLVNYLRAAVCKYKTAWRHL